VDVDFEPTEDQVAVRDLARTIARREFAESAFERRHEYAAPAENMRILGDAGLLGISLPEKYGGSGQHEISAILAIEEIAAVCPVTGDYAVLAMTGPASFIAAWGTEEQKKTYIPPVAAGRERFAISLSEPQAGSALTDLKTSARIVGDTCVLNGQKTFCSAAVHADRFLVFVRFGPGTSGIGAVIVDKDTPGFTISGEHRHMSAAPWSELFFDDAEIPVSQVLLDGNAFSRLMAVYSLERCGAGAYVLGVARQAMDLAVSYAEERTQFGRSISDFQFVQAALSEMYLRMESARLLVHRSIVRAANGLPSPLESSAAKVAATEAACYITDAAMQLHGATGMSQEMPLEWLYRVVRPYTVAGGTSDIHRSMIASALVGRRFDHRLTRGEAK
jgi:alkylation response protein AidB-like acyl-CoA dehydrogenase